MKSLFINLESSFSSDILQAHLFLEYPQVVLRLEKKLMMLHHWQHYIRILILSDMLFKNSVNIYSEYYFLDMVYQSNYYSVLDTFLFFSLKLFQLSDSTLFSFKLSTSPLLINLIITHNFDFLLFRFFNLLTALIFFLSFQSFLVIIWIL